MTWEIDKVRKTSKNCTFSPRCYFGQSLSLFMINSIGYWRDKQGKKAYILLLVFVFGFFFHWEFETLHQIYETLSSLTSRETKSFLLKKKKKNNNMFPWSLFRITLCEVMLGKRYFHCWIESLSRERCLFTVVSAFFVITILVLVKIEKFYQGGR